MGGTSIIKPAAPASSGPTKAPVDASSIGNAFGEDRGYCKTHPDDAQCKLLTATQRTNLAILVSHRLTLAAKSYGDAITQIRVDEQLKKPEEIPTLTDLVIDALAAFGGKAVSTAIKSLRSKPAAALVDLGVGLIDVEKQDDVKSADEGVVSYVITGATSAAKKGGKKAAAGEAKEEFERDQAAAKSYLTQLEEVGGVAFDELFGPTIGNLNDADFILYYHSWDPKVHSTPGYKTAIEERLTKYRGSPASKIGRTFARVHDTKPGSDGKAPSMDQVVRYAGNDDLRDTKLVQHVFMNDVPPALYYYTRDYAGGMVNAPGGDAFMDPKADISDFAEGNWRLLREVEPEFRDAAIATNERIWGVKYETRVDEAVPQPMRHSSPPAKSPGASRTTSKTPTSQSTKPITVPKEFTLRNTSHPKNTGQDLTAPPPVGQDLPDLPGVSSAAQSPVMSID